MAGVQVQKLNFTAPGGFPQPMSAIIEKGCWQCDAPADAFERVSLETSGQMRTDVLFKATSGYISSSYWDPAGKTHYLTVCSRGYCGGVGQVTGDAQTTVYRSNDGGVSWQVIETVDGPASVVASTQQGPLLNTTVFSEGSSGFQYRFRVPGSSVTLEPPEGMTPAYAGATLVGWRSADGKTIYQLDGKTALLTIPQLAGPAEGDVPVRLLSVLPDGDAIIAWTGPKAAGSKNYLGIVKSGALTAVYEAHSSLSIGQWSGESVAFGNVTPLNADAPFYPAIFDLATGEIQVLELYGPVGADAYAGQRNYVRWVSSGRNFRVKGTGDCLNVRESPSTSAKSLGCFVDGVYLQDVAGSDGEEQAEGITWFKVATPAGEQGWASSEFLEGGQLRP